MKNRLVTLTGSGNLSDAMGQRWKWQRPVRAPSGIAVDSSNNVYVADNSNARVQKFHQRRQLSDAMGQLWERQRPVLNPWYYGPVGLRWTAATTFMWPTLTSIALRSSTSSGNYLTQWGSFGSGNGQFEGPSSIAVDTSNNVI